MDYLQVLGLSAASLLVLFLLTKLVGNKQISQMSMFDYVVGITIGSVAAEMATGIDKNGWIAVIAMAVYALFAAAISLTSNHSLKLRRIFAGRTIVLMSDGVLYRENLNKARLDLNEFLSQCRLSGYFDINEIDTAFFEPNGRVSVLPRTETQPAAAKDAGVKTNAAEVPKNVIIDGVLLPQNLEQCQKDEKWLLSQLKSKGYDGFKDVFLATLKKDGTLSVFSGKGTKPCGDPFL